MGGGLDFPLFQRDRGRIQVTLITVAADLVQDAFLRYAFPACEGTAFRLAELGNNAGFYGAAKLFID